MEKFDTVLLKDMPIGSRFYYPGDRAKKVWEVYEKKIYFNGHKNYAGRVKGDGRNEEKYFDNQQTGVFLRITKI